MAVGHRMNGNAVKLVTIILAGAAASYLPATASAQSYNQVVVFGDSTLTAAGSPASRAARIRPAHPALTLQLPPRWPPAAGPS